jgi:DNA-binding CsgD family transcriptional regulator
MRTRGGRAAPGQSMDDRVWTDIMQFGETVCSTLSCATVQRRALPQYMRLLDSDSSGVHLFDGRHRTTVGSVLGMPAEFLYELEQLNRSDSPLVSRACFTRVPVHDAMLHSKAPALGRAPQGQLLRSYGFERCMVAPLIHNSRTIGVICVAREIDRPPFRIEEQRLAARLARFVSIALTNAAVHEAVAPAEESSDEPSEVQTVRLAPGESVATLAGRQAIAAGVRATLTDREAEVFDLLAGGLTNAAIGQELGITPNTVKRHVQHIYAKLGVHSRVAAVRHGAARPTARSRAS